MGSRLRGRRRRRAGNAKEERVGGEGQGGEARTKLELGQGDGRKVSEDVGTELQADELSRGIGEVLNVATLEGLVRWSRYG